MAKKQSKETAMSFEEFCARFMVPRDSATVTFDSVRFALWQEYATQKRHEEATAATNRLADAQLAACKFGQENAKLAHELLESSRPEVKE